MPVPGSYWLIGVPQAYYMVPAMEAPVEEVLDVLALAIRPAPLPDACPAGSSTPPGRRGCVACSAGTYAAVPGSRACKRCVPGRAAPQLGTVGCRTAQPGAYALPGGVAFLPCPQGTFSALPGAWAADQCLAPAARRRTLEEQALSPALLAKLSPLFARALHERRALAQSAAPGASLTTVDVQAPLTAHELCLTQQLAGAVHGYGGGPYRLPAVNCPLPTPAPAPAPSAATMFTGGLGGGCAVPRCCC